MKIAIIGAGFTGLASAYRLSQHGHKVTLFEKDSLPGGLAIGFRQKEWQWSLEEHYHHWFTNDNHALKLAKEINFEVLTNRPKTSVYINNQIYQLDSPLHLLKFPLLCMLDRLKMAAVIGLLRYNPFWKPLEKIRAEEFLKKALGSKGYDTIWAPQLKNKFGEYAKEISLAWFWARIKKRTPSLAYPKGGFLEFAKAICKQIEKKKGKVLFEHTVWAIKSNTDETVTLTLSLLNDSNHFTYEQFDRVIVTLPSFSFLKITPSLPSYYQKKMSELRGLGAINLILRLKKPFLTDGTYWLSICENSSPIMAVVDHTNFIDKKFYKNEHIVYVGIYCDTNDKRFNMSEDKLLDFYDPFLKKINPSYRLSLISYHLFKAPFAQPIIPINYSKMIPPFQTPLKNVYLANIEQVYPWDRGTNYAIELGEKIAKLIVKV